MTSFSPAACSEHELIEAARDGNDRAFEELYARYRERICAFIQSRVGDHGRAEDVAQEVFISALRRLRASDQTIQFKPWIYEIAKNACIDEFRRTRRAREVSLDADQDSGTPRPLLSLAPTPPAAVETKQRMADLRGAFGGLSENHHQLLVLREFEGLSYDEIGARTGMSRQMVESALFRARRKLTEEYNELASGRRCEQIQTAIDDGRALSARAFGLRERRQFARHLAHCQPCRAKAQLAGVDDSLVRPRSLGAKIAALLPFPLLRWPLHRAGRAARTVAVEPSSSQLASALSEPGASALGGAAVAAAVLALAGAGIVTGAPTGHQALHRTGVTSRLHSGASHPSLPPASTGAAPIAHGAGGLGASPASGVRHPATPLSHAGPHPATPAAPRSAPGPGSGASRSSGPVLPGAAQHVAGAVPGSAQPVVKSAGHVLGSTTTTLQKVTAPVTQGVTATGQQLHQVTQPASSAAQQTVTNTTQAAGNAANAVGAHTPIAPVAGAVGQTTAAAGQSVNSLLKTALGG